MSLIPANNPFQLQKKPLRRSSPNNQPKISPVQTTFSSSRAFGAVKMARFMAPDSSRDSFQASSSFDKTYQPTTNTSLLSSSRQAARLLQDTRAGLLQSLSSPARSRDAAPLASNHWLPDATVDTDISDEVSSNPWQYVKEKLMDLFFEPAPEQSTPSAAASHSKAGHQKERPIGIAQLTRVTFSNANTMPQRSPIDRLKKNN